MKDQPPPSSSEQKQNRVSLMGIGTPTKAKPTERQYPTIASDGPEDQISSLELEEAGPIQPAELHTRQTGRGSTSGRHCRYSGPEAIQQSSEHYESYTFDGGMHRPPPCKIHCTWQV